MSKLNKITWAGDVKAAIRTVTGKECTDTPTYFNDRHKTCRRIKLSLSDHHVTEKNLKKIQRIIQERRPNHSVQVSEWKGTSARYGTGQTYESVYGNVVIYYRQKDSIYIDHSIL